MWISFLLACAADSASLSAPAVHKGPPTPATEDWDWWRQSPGDADGDGFTVGQGDCNDGRADVHPGIAWDGCDGRDSDCDGEVDQDDTGDAWEPNDTVASNLGDLTQVVETLIFGTVPSPADVDRFLFYVEDGSASWFDIEVWIYGVPPSADFALSLEWVEDVAGQYQGVVDSRDSAGKGGSEFVEYSGLPTLDETGWYEVQLQSSVGGDCRAPYWLQILVGGV